MIQTTRICDRCGVKETSPIPGEPIPTPTILPVSLTKSHESIEADLCPVCMVIVFAAVRAALRKPDPTILTLE
jgi:hypothetical protein